MDRHAARPVAFETFMRRDGERLDTLRISRPPWDMNLRGADRCGDATVKVAFKITNGALAGGVIAECNVDMRINQAGNRRHAAGVNDDVCRLDGMSAGSAYLDEAIPIAKDGVAAS